MSSDPGVAQADGRQFFLLDDGDKVLSVDETASRLGVVPQTLKQWRMRGYGPRHLRIGRRIGYRLRSIREWLDQVEHQSTLEPGRILQP